MDRSTIFLVPDTDAVGTWRPTATRTRASTAVGRKNGIEAKSTSATARAALTKKALLWPSLADTAPRCS